MFPLHVLVLVGAVVGQHACFHIEKALKLCLLQLVLSMQSHATRVHYGNIKMMATWLHLLSHSNSGRLGRMDCVGVLKYACYFLVHLCAECRRVKLIYVKEYDDTFSASHIISLIALKQLCQSQWQQQLNIFQIYRLMQIALLVYLIQKVNLQFSHYCCISVTLLQVFSLLLLTKSPKWQLYTYYYF